MHVLKRRCCQSLIPLSSTKLHHEICMCSFSQSTQAKCFSWCSTCKPESVKRSICAVKLHTFQSLFQCVSKHESVCCSVQPASVFVALFKQQGGHKSIMFLRFGFMHVSICEDVMLARVLQRCSFVFSVMQWSNLPYLSVFVTQMLSGDEGSLQGIHLYLLLNFNEGWGKLYCVLLLSS